MSITYERVRELFDYSPYGSLIWKISKGGAKAGSVAGSSGNRGYCFISVDRRPYRAHRLIWLWHKGYMPEGGLDHRNRVKGDNRIENLREASQLCNTRNTDNHKNNKSGVKGVLKVGKGWLASISLNNKDRRLGVHLCFDEAVLHRLAAEQCLDWASCDSSSPAYSYAIDNDLIKA